MVAIDSTSQNQYTPLERGGNFSMFQDRPIYRISNAIYNPISLSLIDGALTRGSARCKNWCRQ